MFSACPTGKRPQGSPGHAGKRELAAFRHKAPLHPLLSSLQKAVQSKSDVTSTDMSHALVLFQLGQVEGTSVWWCHFYFYLVYQCRSSEVSWLYWGRWCSSLKRWVSWKSFEKLHDHFVSCFYNFDCYAETGAEVFSEFYESPTVQKNAARSLVHPKPSWWLDFLCYSPYNLLGQIDKNP